MGIFSPSKKELERQHQEWLHSGEIQYNPQWGRHREGHLPEIADLVARATAEAGRDPATIDLGLVSARFARVLVGAAQLLFEKITGSWDDCLVVLNRPDLTMELFSNYLTTIGAGGIAAYNKLVQIMTGDGVLIAVANDIRAGEYDLETPVASAPSLPIGGAGRIDEALRQGLLESGFEQMSPGLYRGTADSHRVPGRRHNVFVGIEDGAVPTVMTPVGLIENVSESDLEEARDPGDGCTASTGAASYRILIRPLRIDHAAPELASVLEAAFALAAYGDLIQERLNGPQQELATALAKGENIPLTAINLEARVEWWSDRSEVSVDCSGLLLDSGGRVRGDHDFVFYNQSSHTRSAVHYVPAHAEDGYGVGGLRISLTSMEDDVERITVIASTDGAPFSAMTGLSMTVVDMDTGARVATFVPEGIGLESALVLCEVYRRHGAWRLRAVGQGYASGLAGVATDFGVTVD